METGVRYTHGGYVVLRIFGFAVLVEQMVKEVVRACDRKGKNMERFLNMMF